MIYLYSGTPGSGKSLHLANIIWQKLRSGRPVIANFPIQLDIVAESTKDYIKRKIGIKNIPKPLKLARFDYVDISSLTVDYLIKHAMRYHKPNRENQTLLIIDECAVIFNSRQWDNKDRQQWIVFFQQHRKLGYNVILVSQSDRLIDRQIRAFIEYEVKHRCLNNYRLLGKILGMIAGGKLFVALEYWYGVKERTDTQHIRLNRRKASIYDTFKIFEKSSNSVVKGKQAVPAGVPLTTDTEDIKSMGC